MPMMLITIDLFTIYRYEKEQPGKKPGILTT